MRNTVGPFRSVVVKEGGDFPDSTYHVLGELLFSAIKEAVERLKVIPLEDIAPVIEVFEAEHPGVWCLVGGELLFVSPGGRCATIEWYNPLEYFLFARWAEARPERVHATPEAAVAFVRAALA